MSVTMISYPHPSTDGVHTLAGRVYLPEGYPDTPARGILHVAHGMIEHISRYDGFMREMAEFGWIVCGYDHLGHGESVNDPSERGYIAKKDGWIYLQRDVAAFSEAVRGAYGKDSSGRELPYVLMGHSMGSFITRLAMTKYVHPDAVILMGTGGPRRFSGMGIPLVELIKLVYGDKHYSNLIEQLSIGTFNERFGGTKNAPNPVAWMTDDEAVCKTFLEDEMCHFRFTSSAMGDVIRLSHHCNRRNWYRAVPKDIPILLISGDADPVGNYGRSVRLIEARLLKAGVPVTCRLYDGMRHEILNSGCCGEVKEDIKEFLRGVRCH